MKEYDQRHRLAFSVDGGRGAAEPAREPGAWLALREVVVGDSARVAAADARRPHETYVGRLRFVSVRYTRLIVQHKRDLVKLEFTSVEEVIFDPAFVCLSVSNLTQNLLIGSSWKFWTKKSLLILRFIRIRISLDSNSRFALADVLRTEVLLLYIITIMSMRVKLQNIYRDH